MIRPPPISTLFPYTTLFRSAQGDLCRHRRPRLPPGRRRADRQPREPAFGGAPQGREAAARRGAARRGDRKSTRLNSSHLGISYAVFCLKKKKEKQTIRIRVT